MAELTEVSSNKCFAGYQKVYSHYSKELSCKMNFAIYLPPQAEDSQVPVIYWLSGLTCNELNFVQKAGAQRYAAEHGVILVAPDTSPRGCNVAGEDDSYDFGTGAGFFVDATQAPYDKNYRMHAYVTGELLDLVVSNFPAKEGSTAIMGHSMGGHGALVCALKNPGLYKSVSAFSPICNPGKCPWGRKALAGYLGADEADNWAQWDATELVKQYNGPTLELYIDQGKEDQFLKEEQLLPGNLMAACKDAHVPFVYQLREGYDHSYFFIASFIGEHIKRHAAALKD